jgi:hypothetical protein
MNSEPKAYCFDCGLDYDKFEDLVLPDDVWKQISPTGDEGGLLCPTCIANRMYKIGLWYDNGFFNPKGSATKTGTLTCYDEDHNAWECSKCGSVWEISNPDSPLENNIHYCQNCGVKFTAYSTKDLIDVFSE